MNIDTYNELIEKLRKNINNITINQEVDANLESLSDAWNNKFTKNCYQIIYGHYDWLLKTN